MFFDNQNSREKEARLLKSFIHCLDDVVDYLDEYDEFYGLAFNKDDPMGCTERLMNFLSERHHELIKD